MSAVPAPPPPEEAPVADVLSARRALGATGLLREFNEAGVLAAADVHVATRLSDLAGEEDEAVRLAFALAVRGPRLGHVLVDLSTIAGSVTVDAEDAVDVGALPWPSPVEDWVGRVAASPLVAVGEEPTDDARPLRLLGTSLYLDRYWAEERQVAGDLEALAGSLVPGLDEAAVTASVGRVLGERSEELQERAIDAAVRRRLAVVAGGPGTGKTTTVAAIAALILEHSDPEQPPLIGLAAPTAKAAARLAEAVREAAVETLAVPAGVRDALLELDAMTLHRLLGWIPGRESRIRHHRGNRLPHDVVIVDEASMLSLSAMRRLVEAVRPDARLVLVGDPGQLTSIEAGAVLADVVGPAADEGAGASGAGGAAIADGIVVLRRVHRYGSEIGDVAEAIRRGDADGALAALDGAPGVVTWLRDDAAEASEPALAPVREAVVAAGRRLHEAAAAGEARTALDVLGELRVLCAHRRGPHGVATWTERIERWLGAAIDGFAAEGPWYVGRPLLVTQNDYELRLFNGDTGVILAPPAGSPRGTRPAAVFDRRGDLLRFGAARLESVETVHAMTVHKSQGSQFGTAVVLLPDTTSQILTRELLYTAVTRAKERLIVVGTEEVLRAAIGRPVARASGLRSRLWAADTPR